jgi:DNA-binding SARP family transcriptional activator
MLRIRMLGDLDLHRDDKPFPPFPTQAARDLFAFIELNRSRLHPREVLVGLFWGDRPEEKARHNLRTTLWRMRRVVESDADATPHVVARNGCLGLNPTADHCGRGGIREAPGRGARR